MSAIPALRSSKRKIMTELRASLSYIVRGWLGLYTETLFQKHKQATERERKSLPREEGKQESGKKILETLQ